MVKFVSGPSVGAQKSYYNHRIAREGQFRIPRAYGSVKNEVNIKVRNYHYCGGSSYSGWQMPGWLQWLGFGMNFLQSLIPQRPTYTEKPQVQVQTNPLQSQLDELNDRIDELEAENKKLKEGSTAKKEEPKTDFTVESEITQESNEIEKEVKENVPGKDLRTAINITRNPNNSNQTTGWDRIIDGYVGPDNKPASSAERKQILQQLRQELFNGDQNKFFNGGEQFVPNTIKIGDKTFTFNKANYDNSNKWVDLGGNITSVNTEAKRTEATTTTKKVTEEVTTFKGKTTVTINGKQEVLTTKKGYNSQSEAVEDLKAQIKNSKSLTEEQKEEALRNISAAKVKKQ